MSLKFSPPGSKRVRGIQRAQVQVIKRLLKAQLAFAFKTLARRPPVIYLNDLNFASFNAAVTACQSLLDQVN
jgi:hypothetical protein